ncbi:MAG: hypothetical protein E7549_00420 [Ruminococcaceae bacterium]|nr:hypothetical protein [Oscillospiraceae bacterium]
MFSIHHTRDGRVPPTECLPAVAGNHAIGDLLVFSDGLLTPVSAELGAGTDDGRHFVSVAEKVCEEGDLLPVVAAGEDVVLEVALTKAVEGIAPGAVCTVSGSSLEAVAEGGAFTVLQSDGTAVGDLQRGVLI